MITATVTATTLLAAPLVAHRAAAADCAAPKVTFRPARVARGAVLTITGQYLGDDCLDTGTLPPGVGPLGLPLEGLAIVINQGTNEFLVATGSANSEYSFEVTSWSPPVGAGRGGFSLVGSGDARMTIDLPLVISTAPPTPIEGSVVTFGPPTPDTSRRYRPQPLCRRPTSLTCQLPRCRRSRHRQSRSPTTTPVGNARSRRELQDSWRSAAIGCEAGVETRLVSQSALSQSSPR